MQPAGPSRRTSREDQSHVEPAGFAWRLSHEDLLGCGLVGFTVRLSYEDRSFREPAGSDGDVSREDFR